MLGEMMVWHFCPICRGKVTNNEEPTICQEPIDLCDALEQMGTIDPMEHKVDNDEIKRAAQRDGMRFPLYELNMRKSGSPICQRGSRGVDCDAMRSDPRAMKLLLFLIDRYAESPEAAPHLEEMLAEDREILMHFLQQPAGTAAERGKKSESTERRDG